MARRAGRVVRFTTGALEYVDANRGLPRSTYRAFEDEPLYGYPDTAVDLERWFSPGYGATPHISAPRGRSLYVGTRLSYAPPYRRRLYAGWQRFELGTMPHRVGFCVRRKQRREVLFALGRAGYGGSAPKRHYRRNMNSNYGC